MKVRLKRAFFIDGFRYESAGVFEMPDAFAERLPSDAEIVDSVASSPEPPVARKAPAPKAAEKSAPMEKVKGYPLPPKEFKDDKTEASVPYADALNRAVKQFISEAPKNDVDAWNALPADKRKERIEAAADDLLKSF